MYMYLLPSELRQTRRNVSQFSSCRSYKHNKPSLILLDGLGVWCIRFQHWWWMSWKFSKGRISAIYQAVLNVTRFHDQKNRHIYMVYRSCIGGFRTQNPLRNLLKVFSNWIKATFCRILFQFWSWGYRWLFKFISSLNEQEIAIFALNSNCKQTRNNKVHS